MTNPNPKKRSGYGRSHLPNPARDICLFCDKSVSPNDSFSNIDPATGKADMFHMSCFKVAVNNMLKETREKKVKNET